MSQFWSRTAGIILLLFGASSITTVSADSLLPPKKDQQERTRAQGSRGCPETLGILEVVGSQSLTTQEKNPSIIFWVEASQKPQTLLITLNSLDYKETLPVFSKQFTVRGTGFLIVPIEANLKANTLYHLSAGLLCQNSIIGASLLEISLRRVEQFTTLDRAILTYYQLKKQNRINEVEVEKTICSGNNC